MRRVSSYFLTRSLTSCWCGRLCRKNGFLPYCNRSSCHVLWDVVSDQWSNGSETRDLRRVFQVRERLVCLRQALLSRTNKSDSLTYTVASSSVSTSPLNVTTLKSAGLKVFPADHMHAYSGVHHKLIFLQFYCGWSRQNPLIGRRKECSCFLFLCAYRYSWQVSTRLRGRIALVFQSPPEISPQVSQRRDGADEEVWLVFYSAMDHCLLGCLLDAAQLLRIVLIELVPKLLCPSVKSLTIPVARHPATHNPTVVHLSLLLLHLCHPSSALCLVVPQPSSAEMSTLWLSIGLPRRTPASEAPFSRRTSTSWCWWLRRWRGFWCRFCTLMTVVPETALVPFRTLSFFFPLVTTVPVSILSFQASTFRNRSFWFMLLFTIVFNFW